MFFTILAVSGVIALLMIFLILLPGLSVPL